LVAAAKPIESNAVILHLRRRQPGPQTGRGGKPRRLVQAL